MSAGRARCGGQAATDYLLLVALVSLALGLGADAPVHGVLQALAERFGRFTWAISLP
jgi:hypothetical protein